MGVSPTYKAKLRNLNATPQPVNAAPATLYGIQIENNQGADAWVQIFDNTAPVPGTDSPDKEFKVSANSSRSHTFVGGSRFDTGISVCSTTTEKGAIGSNSGVQVFVDYQ